METYRLLDVVALTVDIPEKGLYRGQVGTIVEILNSENFEVEFNDNSGKTYAVEPISSINLMVLNYHAVAN